MAITDPAITSNGTSTLATAIHSTKDLTDSNITPNAIAINTQGTTASDPRLTYIITRLITHLHDFARETRLTTSEWEAGLEFLTATGQNCTPTRQEFILLSDILGLSTLVEAINHPKPPQPTLATEGTVLGPFHTHDAPITPNGASISSDHSTTAGTPLIVKCNVVDASVYPPRAIKGATITTWETDSTGHYDVQYSNRGLPDNRGVLRSDEMGGFSFRCIVPVSYPVPHDGPVGRFLKLVGRHPWRPAHIHFKIEKEGYDTLVTALYVRGDRYEGSDAVFGVKSSLVVDIVEEEVERKKVKMLRYTFGLVTEKDARELREKKAREALKGMGSRARIVEGLPVADLD